MRNKLMIAILAMAFMMAAQPVFGGDMDSPGEPSNPASNTYTLEDIYNRLDTGADGTQQPFTSPPAGAITPTGYTIDEVMGKAPAVDDTNGATPADVEAGKWFWGLTSGSWGLQEGTGTGLDVPATGQTTCYNAAGAVIVCAGTGQDGEYQKGATAGFTNNGDGTVTDNLTGLMWTKDANIDGQKAWSTAKTYCEGLTTGGYNDWRLPSIEELRTLIDFSQYNPALPSGHPFAGVQSGGYWSSSSHAGDPSYAWNVDLNSGYVVTDGKAYTSYVWPVRGGN